ncbi:MAG TPA: hypothetical protein VF449_03755 [Parvibaculum sp.]
MTHSVVRADPYKVHVPEEELQDLKLLLQRTRFPNEPPGQCPMGEYGTSLPDDLRDAFAEMGSG